MPKCQNPNPSRKRVGRNISGTEADRWGIVSQAVPAAELESTVTAIARELMVSLNTMRTHTKNIYAKLAVTNRRAAVRRAAELNLLPRTHRPQP